jgi:hypothetical protein
MTMKSLMSAAHAAGFAMAPEDLGDPVVPMIGPAKPGTALVVRPVHTQTSIVLRAPRLIRRYLLREWFGTHWGRRAAA